LLERLGVVERHEREAVERIQAHLTRLESLDAANQAEVEQLAGELVVVKEQVDVAQRVVLEAEEDLRSFARLVFRELRVAISVDSKWSSCHKEDKYYGPALHGLVSITRRRSSRQRFKSHILADARGDENRLKAPDEDVRVAEMGEVLYPK
jgi:hypothetical protein